MQKSQVMRAQCRPNPDMERGGGHGVLPVAEELIAKIAAGTEIAFKSIAPSKSITFSQKTTHQRMYVQYKMDLMGLIKTTTTTTTQSRMRKGGGWTWQEGGEYDKNIL